MAQSFWPLAKTATAVEASEFAVSNEEHRGRVGSMLTRTCLNRLRMLFNVSATCPLLDGIARPMSCRPLSLMSWRTRFMIALSSQGVLVLSYRMDLPIRY